MSRCLPPSNKFNIYQDARYIHLPTVPTPLPPKMTIYLPLSKSQLPYPTPTYYPPHCNCTK
jgi:hypothetical protein